MQENHIFSYTKRDYEGSRKEGLASIPRLSGGQWTDLNATDPGIIILDYVHALVDMVHYYQDHQALEVFLSTAKERENIFRAAKKLSYKVRSAKGATCEVLFTSALKYDYTVKIPKHTVLSTRSSIDYFTTEDVYMPAGEYKVKAPCSQGKFVSHEYRGTGISRFSSTPGATNQTIRIVDSHIDIDSFSIVDDLGREWEEVEYITFSSGEDRVYQVELNPDDSVTIKFGDGERGRVPQSTDRLRITYVSTLADAGRVNPDEIIFLRSPIVNDQNVRLTFSVTNPQSSTGGSPSQSSQEIREIAPGIIKAQDRAVTLSDFEYLAKLVDGVADAKAHDINTKPDLCLYHEVKVLIIPENIEGSTESLKDRVYSYLSKRMIPPTNLQIITPSYVPINIEITVKKLENTNDGLVSYQVREAVTEFFNNRLGRVGEPFYPADLSSIVYNLDTVRNVISITPNSTVTTEDFSLLKLESVTVNIQ